MNTQELLSKACLRAEHFSQSLLWFSKAIPQNSEFASSFVSLIDQCLATRTDNTQIVTVAVGKSGGVARIFTDMLASVGILARFVHPTEAFHGDFGVIRPRDTIVVVSNGGRSQELLVMVESLKELRNCVVYAITSDPKSPLGILADHVLSLPFVSETCPLNQAPLTSTITALGLCQLIVGSCMEKSMLGINEYATNHPGGAIGKRIFVKADDLMLRGEMMPSTKTNASFAGCVAAMTKFAAAGLLVLSDNGTLHGLVTEKDLRVAMESFGAQVFEKTVTDFMNSKPITILSGSLAIDALALMENRPRPLNVLPVVNSEGLAVGLLRIHDLISHGIALPRVSL